MMKQLLKLADFIDYFIKRLGRWTAWLTLATVLVTFLVVVLRYVFETGSLALQESISYLHATVFMLGAAYTLQHDAHVRVDIVYHKLSARQRARIEIFGILMLLMPVCFFMITVSVDYVAASWSVMEGSQEAGGLDAVFILKTLIPVMAGLLILQGTSLLIRSSLVLTGHDSAQTGDAPDDIGP